MKESHFVSEHKTFAWCKKSTFPFVKPIRNKEGQYDKKIFRVSFQALRKTILTFLLEKLDEGLGKLAVLFATGNHWKCRRERDASSSLGRQE